MPCALITAAAGCSSFMVLIALVGLPGESCNALAVAGQISDGTVDLGYGDFGRHDVVSEKLLTEIGYYFFDFLFGLSSENMRFYPINVYRNGIWLQC